jgi:hypothetical protein
MTEKILREESSLLDVDNLVIFRELEPKAVEAELRLLADDVDKVISKLEKAKEVSQKALEFEFSI